MAASHKTFRKSWSYGYLHIWLLNCRAFWYLWVIIALRTTHKLTHTAIVFIIIAIAFYIFQYDSLPAHDLLMVVLSNAIACFVFNELPTASTPFKWMLLPKQFPWDHFNRFTSFLEYNDNLSHFLLFQPKVCFFNLWWVRFSFKIRSLYSIGPIYDTLKIEKKKFNNNSNKRCLRVNAPS